MRNTALGMSMALLAGVTLAACGDPPEPIAPVGPSFDRATESTDTDEADPVLPDVVPQAVPPIGSEPGEIPEVMEDDTLGTGEGDSPDGVMGETGELADEPGAPQ